MLGDSASVRVGRRRALGARRRRGVDHDGRRVGCRTRTPLHAHVSEQPAENDQCRAAHGVTPDRADASDAVPCHRASAPCTPPTLDETDIALLAAAGAHVCMCPTTERDLADGIGPTDRFRHDGVAITLGSDSHAVIDLFEEARAVELDERLATGERGNHAVVDLLAAATNHASLGVERRPHRGGCVGGPRGDRPGLRAARRRRCRRRRSPSVVYAATAADVRHVMVERPVGGAGRRPPVLRRSLVALRSAVAAVWSPDGKPGR
jgi:cytosine/adenosine deaminase-related metal-dependent hydrolase